MSKYIIVTGGVCSSLGKGIAAASIGNLLKAAGYNVFIQKLDLYLNVDPGTMSPFQHGEVFVLQKLTKCYFILHVIFLFPFPFEMSIQQSIVMFAVFECFV